MLLAAQFHSRLRVYNFKFFRRRNNNSKLSLAHFAHTLFVQHLLGLVRPSVSLNVVMKQIIVFKKDKLAYDPTNLICTFCQQTGHTYNFCLGRETIPHPNDKQLYVTQL